MNPEDENLPTPVAELPASVKRTRYEGVPGTLSEPTTAPVVWEPEVSVLQLEQCLRKFKSPLPQSILDRGSPFIESFTWDVVLEMPHIHIHLEVPFTQITPATKAGVKFELEALVSALEPLLAPHAFALSAHLV